MANPTSTESPIVLSEWSAPVAQVPAGGSAKFIILWCGKLEEAFVINVDGRYHAYVNRCAHAGTPLDWWPGDFLSEDGKFLVCGTHGARYEPTTGQCVGGPCNGRALLRLPVRVRAGYIFVGGEGSRTDE